MRNTHRYVLIFFVIIALIVSFGLYLNDRRKQDIPNSGISYKKDELSMNFDTCVIHQKKLFTTGWVAIMSNDKLIHIYLTSSEKDNRFNTQSYRGYDVAKALGLSEQSVARFSASQVLSKEAQGRPVEINIIAESESGQLFGGKYVCNN